MSELNQRARAHRLDGADPGSVGPSLRLADGNEASAGGRIITRSNDRRLRTSATDWVKNGDRWTVLDVHDSGDLTVQHTRHGRIVRLPSTYVHADTELGYASTIHSAQGLTADTAHGLATGQESRQLLYTMLSRAAIANHLYLGVVGDGDPHSVIDPAFVRPLTPTDILESSLARDDAPRSATSLLTEQADPAIRLGEATQRYLDSLYLAAEHTVGPDVVSALDEAVDRLLPGLSDEAAWPTLRAHLLLLATTGQDPLRALHAAASDRELDSAHDRAAVLDWRLDASGMRNAGPGPLPWVPGIPARLAYDPHWGAYLTRRAQLVVELAGQVRDQAGSTTAAPPWMQNGIRPDARTLAEVEVWRAAMQVPPEDRRPTGAPQLQKASATWQRRLDRRITGDLTPALKEWRHLLDDVAPQVHADEFTPLLAERLAAMSRAGVQARQLLRDAVKAGPLPDEHAAAALWWRMARHLTPAVAAQITDQNSVTTGWTPQLAELYGAQRAEQIQASTWWPALVANIDHGLRRGWRLEDLLAADTAIPDDVDDCQALVWRTSISLDPVPDEHTDDDYYDEPPEDMWDGVEPPADAESAELVDLGEEQHIAGDLAVAAMIRDNPAPLEPTDADIARMYERAEQWEHSPVSRERMLEINALTQAFFEDHLAGSWGHAYLTERFGIDLSDHEHFRPGQAPDGWANLVNHLRRQGVTDEEMLATGVASRARSGRLIDRFRGRVMFPVIRPGSHGTEILGFIGRRHPKLADADYRAPKYLNTADTPLFHKGAQLFGFVDELIDAGAIPVLVEGPMDAIAVTLASAGRYVGLAPLGTSLTDEQAAQLAAIGRDPVVATDADLAGWVAAERNFWLLTQHGLDPTYAQLPAGTDPADLLTQHGPAGLAAALLDPQPLGDHLLVERLDNLPADKARAAAIKVLAARPGHTWEPGVDQIGARLHLATLDLRRDLRDAVRAWDADPRKAAQSEAGDLRDVRDRLQAAAAKTPAEPWTDLANELDPRLVAEPDWPATAEILQEAHDQGHDVATAARALVDEAPLDDQPARDLRYRIVSRLDLSVDADETPIAIPSARTKRQDTPPPPGRPRRHAPRR